MQILVKYSKLETKSSCVREGFSLMNAFKGVPLLHSLSVGQHHCIDHQVEK
jgi:hypothetical protein